MLESIKNSFVGKVHEPHSHFIERGIHSITFKFYQDKSSNRYTQSDRDRFNNFLLAMEGILRMNDQVDE